MRVAFCPYLRIGIYDLLENFLFQLCRACQANFDLNSHINPVRYNVNSLLGFLEDTVRLDLTNATNTLTTLERLRCVRNVVVNNKAQVNAQEAEELEPLHSIGVGVNDIGELVFSDSFCHTFTGHCITLFECMRDGLLAKMNGVDESEVVQCSASVEEKVGG